MDEKLLALPWQIQLALGGGYLAYSVAYAGIRSHHRPVDTAFRALAFGLIVVAVLYALPDVLPIPRAGIAITAALAGGALWRKLGMRLWRWILRQSNVSWADDSPSAWSRLQGDSRAFITQVAVLLDDDSWLISDPVDQFESAPFGSCILGENGDLALYVTSVEAADGTVLQSPVRDARYGDQLTYVPANRVKQLVLRHRLGKEMSSGD